MLKAARLSNNSTGIAEGTHLRTNKGGKNLLNFCKKNPHLTPEELVWLMNYRDKKKDREEK